MKRIFTLLATFLTLTIGAVSQNTTSVGTLLAGVDKPKNLYIGQYADNMRDRTGGAMELNKKGGIYIGDFLNGKYNGYGMYITAPGQTIKKIPGTIAIVGEWIDGKVNGHAKCYGPDGEIIYDGMFVDSEPVDIYPSTHIKDQHYFTDWEDNLNNEYYVGEMFNGRPDGFGIFVLPDGGRSIGRVKAGHRTGMSVIIYDNSAWMVVKYDPKVNGYELVYSTKEVNARKERYDYVRDQTNAALRKEFSQLMDEGIQLMNSYAEMKNKNNEAGSDYYAGDYDSSGSSSHSASKKSPDKGKGNDCGTAWMNAKRVYSDYETQLVPGGPRSATSDSDRRNIKSKMRSIRQKWEKRGCQFTKSPYED